MSVPPGQARNPLEQAIVAIYSGQLDEPGFLQEFDGAPVWVPLVNQPDGRQLFHVVSVQDHAITAIYTSADRLASTKLGQLPHTVMTGRAFARALHPNISVLINSGIADQGLVIEMAPHLISQVARGIELNGVTGIGAPPEHPQVHRFLALLADAFRRGAPVVRTGRPAWLTYSTGALPRLMVGLELEAVGMDDALPVRAAIQQAVRAFPAPPGFDLGIVTLPPEDPNNPVAAWITQNGQYFYRR